MGSTDSRAIELGPALRALAESAAPTGPDAKAARAESARRHRAVSARARIGAIAAAAMIAVGLPLALRGPRSSAPSPSAGGAASELAARVLETRASTHGGLEAEIDDYIVALWGSAGGSSLGISD